MFAAAATRTVLPLLLAVLGLLAPALSAGEKPSQNLFTNPSFEDGREAWRMDKAGKTDAKFTAEKGDAAAGEYGALVTIGAVEEWGTQFGQSFDAPAKGKTYTFAAVLKATKGPVDVYLEIERSGKPYDRAAKSERCTLKKDVWTEYHVTFTVAKDFREGWFAYVSCVQPNAEYRLDMVRLYEGEYVPYGKAAKEAAAASGVGVFDTGAQSPAAIPGEAIAAKAGWTQAPEGQAAYQFKGDAVCMNDRLAVVLRRKGMGAEVYSAGPKGWTARALLAPAGGKADARLESVAIGRNAADAAALDASFKLADGKAAGAPAIASAAAGLRFEVAMGQAFVKTEARPSTASGSSNGGAAALRIDAPSRFAVLPDFFADDIVVDAADIPVAQADLPSENFLLHLLGRGDAILMAVSADRGEDFRISLAGHGADRTITSSEIPYGKSGKAWVAVLDAPGIWHRRDVAKDETDKIVRIDWKTPFPAQWRVDWHQADKLTGSWEMIAERSGGEFEKPGVFGSPSTVPANRKRWTTVLGSFLYPCWVDREGQGFFQPLRSKVVRFEGPALIYPINRVKGTPLGVFTMADIARATLGVGPCEYILDLEGQGSTSKGRATCSTRDALRPIYQAREQKAKRAEIERLLDEVMVFIRHIRGRIETYSDFSHTTLAYLQEQQKAHPELAPFVAEMTPLCKAVDRYYDARRDEIKTVDYTQGMVDNFRKTMIDYEGADAYEKCRKFTEDVVVIGGNQDELAGEGRMAVKVIRQRAALAGAVDPRFSAAAREIRSRTQQVLRNPAGHEGARH